MSDIEMNVGGGIILDGRDSLWEAIMAGWRRRGFAEDEALAWMAVGWTPLDAAYWQRVGFSPEQSLDWFQAAKGEEHSCMRDTAEAAELLFAHGLTPVMAAAYMAESGGDCFTAASIAAWRKRHEHADR